ncbi:hypothetical protein [Desulfitobacterium sp.]|uniref:hypothetical protein n=1 Tax=Desulfitobacterium sp. TaxID=49981 RepID=UPI002B21DCAF|nr:hypothetical protein [Desulfitobacterium sp.]MEA4900321.1 hypothetical protein [Desulfitobacterium sp.]
MLDSYSSRKQRQHTYLVSNLSVGILIIALSVSLFIIGLTNILPLTIPVQFVDTQSKDYIEEEFRHARWFPLVESIETTENQITLNTYIFPDQNGQELAAEIVKNLRTGGVKGEISVYGKNMSNRLLVKSKE